jgi:cobalt-zinc-cadmium efflux system outer membrane protein
LFELGNVTELRNVNERAFYEEMRVQQARAEAKVKAAREQLNAELGLWGAAGAKWTAIAPTPLQSFDDVTALTTNLESRAVEASLSLSASRLRYEAFAKQANLTRFAGWFPQVHAGVRVARQKDDGEPAKWGAGPMVELGVPIFYQGQGETSSALAEMRRQEASLDDIAIRTRSASRAAIVRLETTAQMAQHYRDVILPLRGQVVEQTQLQYNAMSIGVFELLQAKNMEISAHLTYLDVLREYWTLRLDVDQLLAGGLRAGNTRPAPDRQSSTLPAGAAHD